MNDCEIIRQFERDILDKFHESLDFYQYPEDIVIPYLMQVYGDFERYRDRLEENGRSGGVIDSYLSNLVHGISHCIRWIKLQNNPKYSSEKHLSPDGVHAIANDYAYWGAMYHTIAQEFVVWSRGIKDVSLDRSKKIISFLQTDKYDYASVFGLQKLYRQRLNAAFDGYPHKEMDRIFSEWIKAVDLSKPPIANSINWSKAKESELFPLLMTKMEQIIFPELEGTISLGGYTLTELRRFFALFFINFYFIRWIEAYLDTQSGKNIAFGSNPLYLNKLQFLKLGRDITGLGNEVLSSIIDDFTFDHTNFHSSISIQPFIYSRSGLYYILPNLFCLVEPSRMIVGALNKGPKKKIYAKLINDIEKFSLRVIAGAISTNPLWKYFVEKTLKYGGRQFQPDVIIIESQTKNICVIDYKHYVGPITASEVQYKMSECEKAIGKLEEYISVLSNLKTVGNQNIDGFSVYGILLTHKPLPVPMPVGMTVQVTDLETLLSALEKKPSCTTLIPLIKQLPADAEPPFIEEDAEIEVVDWTIKRTVFKKQTIV